MYIHTYAGKYNATLDDNVKLKTKLALLEKENTQMKKAIDSGISLLPNGNKLAAIKKLLDDAKGHCAYLK